MILADNAFCYDLDGLFCVWQNELNDDDSVSIYLDFFEEQEDGSYCRFSEDFTERIYTDEFLSELVKSNDFELIGSMTILRTRQLMIKRREFFMCAGE